tara:strand:- start:1086 stop:1448 length:363 start_codon:yes stop_codon:yes gene_type:complete
MTINVGGNEVKRGEQKVTEVKKPEPPFNTSDYSCQILQEKTTFDKSNDRKLPSDAFNVTYVVDGEKFLDVTRSSKMVNVFDMYYDRYGKDSVQKIEFGHGTVNPSMYGYKKPEKKARKKR